MDVARAADEWKAAARGFEREGRNAEAAEAREKAKAVRVGERKWGLADVMVCGRRLGMIVAFDIVSSARP
jgi:hypothetical protein